MCLSVCLPVAPLLSQEGPLLGGWRGGKGGLGRAKGGAEALRWVWAPVRVGASGPCWAVPRPAGGSERGPRVAAGRSHTPPGPRGPEQRTGWGGGRGRQAGEGLEGPRVGGHRDLRAPHPSPQPPHAGPAGLSVPEALRVPWPGQAG